MKKEKNNKNNYIKRSLKFFKDVKGKILILTFFYILIALIGFLTPILEAKLITSITSNVAEIVILVAIGLLTIRVLDEFLWFICFRFWRKKIRLKILFNIRKFLMDNVLSLQISNFDKYQTGLFQERAKTDPAIIARVVNAGQRYLMLCITNVGVLIYCLKINVPLALIYISGITIVALIDNYTQKVSKQKNKKLRKTEEEANSILSEVIRGARDIKLLNFKENIEDKVLNKLETLEGDASDKDIFDNKMLLVRQIVLITILLFVVLIGIKFVSLDVITTDELIVLYFYSGNIFSLMSNFSGLRSLLKEYELAVERIFDLEDEEKFPKDKFGSTKIKDFKGKIEFDNVSFSYQKNKKVLDNLSFVVEAKDTVAIIGSSGSGKTTIFNLLTKGYLASSGVIKLDDVNINDLDEETIRKNISIITQNPYIFNMSIKDNLKLVKPNATKKELDEVCKEACFYDYVMSLPKKYDTIIGEGGVNLSGGQRQRLAIARALLKNCKILLFDEATSALDNITQKEIQESIDNISKDYTIIIIAHRLSTIINCNRIYILNEGKIVDVGTHDELLKRNKEYKKLYSAEIKG